VVHLHRQSIGAASHPDPGAERIPFIQFASPDPQYLSSRFLEPVVPACLLPHGLPACALVATRPGRARQDHHRVCRAHPGARSILLYPPTQATSAPGFVGHTAHADVVILRRPG